MKPKISQTELEAIAYKNHIGTISPQERQLLDQWYESFDDTVFFHQDKQETVKLRMWTNVRNTIGSKKSAKLWPRIISAACMVIVAGFGIYYLAQHKTPKGPVFTGTQKDINPGENKAYLILANGQRIDLTSAKTGTITAQPGTEITKLNSGALEYHPKDSGTSAGRLYYNTIETPFGGQYKVTLPDGSEIWLNSGSTLRYPVSFSGAKERKVELSGEAYFEIAKDAGHPFIVKSRTQEITVLGTHFNVNTYADEPSVNTTLIEGSIKLSNTSAAVILKPGERSVNNGQSILVRQVDVAQDIAWKNGYFEFYDTDLRTVMRQISRWYGLTVFYTGKMPAKRFTGKIHRNMKLSGTLKILSYFDVNFVVSDQNIYINN